jgi:hypothetical protein
LPTSTDRRRALRLSEDHDIVHGAEVASLKRYANDGLFIAKTWHRIAKQERGEERRAESMLEYDAPTTG